MQPATPPLASPLLHLTLATLSLPPSPLVLLMIINRILSFSVSFPLSVSLPFSLPFPFGLVLDRDLRIVQVGEVLRRRKAVEVGEQADATFKVLRPRGAQSLAEIDVRICECSIWEQAWLDPLSSPRNRTWVCRERTAIAPRCAWRVQIWALWAKSCGRCESENWHAVTFGITDGNSIFLVFKIVVISQTVAESEVVYI
mgnify:CR=1 FL=1